MTAEEKGVAAVARFLEQAEVAHEVLEHEPTYSATEEAQATGEEPRHTAKTLLLHDHSGWRLAVLPATHRLDLDKARRLLGGTRHLRLATEAEMADQFPAFDVGALPPVGSGLPLPEAVDVRLLYRDHVVFPAGDHRHGVRLDPRDLIRLAEPRVGDLCEHEGPPRRKDFADLPRV
jgi:Ala-tRNA(Pro) deacylase